MKKYLYYSVAALALASCSSDSFFGTDAPPRPDNEEEVAIVFGNQTGRPTRAGEVGGAEAAAKLNNNFIVYGFKYEGSEDLTSTANDQVVFDKYNVNYEEGTAGTTESNTANWEYVGYETHQGSSEKDQTIKYWDYSAEGYVFSAVSGLGVEATKTTTGSTVYDKGWTVNIPAGGDLSTLYASDRNPVAKADFGNTVTLTFRALGTKVRFAMYETVPGYSVHVDKFYYDNTSWKNTETNFAINGTFKNAKADAVTPLTVTYYDNASGIENRPKVTFNDGDVTTGTWGIFGANIQASPALGTTSVEATYDQSDKSYTMILPYESQALSTPEDNILELYVDYTLTSTGGSGEQIHVKHASAKVPTNYTQWRPNFAYTYIFKISDNTNGTTGDPNDPDDPTDDPGDDPKGLFPITFDAAVIADETDLQETITTVSEPSITTYAKGKIVTENDEYTAGDVYFSVMAGDPATLQNLVNHGEVFEVKNFGSIEKNITEEVVQNWKNNFCLLMPVPTTTSVTAVPLSNGTELAFTAGTLGVFQAKAGKTYAIHYNTTDTWKVVKVVGSEAAAVSYTQAMSTASITTAAGKAVYSLKASSPVANTMVLGATACLKIFKGAEDVTNNFTITDKLDGTYDIALTTAAIAAGANGTYTVKFNGTACATDFTVGLSYALTSSPVTVVTAGTTATFTLTDGTNAISKAVIKNLPAGVTITETATAGTYKVAASAEATPGSYTTVTVAGQALTINVDTYAFYNVPEFTFNYLGTDAAKTLNLRKNYSDADVAVSAMTGIETGVATITKASAGAYTVVPVAPGTYTVKYENTSATIVVNQYTLTASESSIAKSTGSTVLTLKKNNGTVKTVNASTAKVTVKKGSSVVTSGFSLITNGQSLKFGNVTTAGTYTFEYTESGKVVAVATVTVI